jgi:formamidopyrimidine-DNA glycosylase
VPELPEVETIRRDLHRELADRRIQTVVAAAGRSIRRHPDAGGFAAALVGTTVTAVDRRGKYLVVRLHGADDRVQVSGTTLLVIHLGMSGQLLLTAAGEAPQVHTHVILGFGPELELRFVDPRTFGEMFVSASRGASAGEPPCELAHLGPDPLADVRSAAQLGRLLHARTTKLKPLLMDQCFLAGIGNLYADEILFAARLRYDRSAATLTTAEIRRLYAAITGILETAIAHRGSSLADEQYRDVFGAVGDFQGRHLVYDRAGRPCTRCRRTIIRVKTGGRSSYLCPYCQA